MSKQTQQTQVTEKQRRFTLLEWSQIVSGFATCLAAFFAAYAANKANSISLRVAQTAERNGCITDLVKSTDSLKDGLYGLIKILAQAEVDSREFSLQASLEKLSETEALLDQFDADLRKHHCTGELALSEGMAADFSEFKRILKQGSTDQLELKPVLDHLNELESKKIYRTCCSGSL